MSFPTEDPNFDPQTYTINQMFNTFKKRRDSQPVIGNPLVTGAIVGVNNALTPPIASVVTPMVNAAGNAVNGLGSIVTFGAIGLGALLLLKILK